LALVGGLLENTIESDFLDAAKFFLTRLDAALSGTTTCIV
jgi:hypothetical protein